MSACIFISSHVILYFGSAVLVGSLVGFLLLMGVLHIIHSLTSR